MEYSANENRYEKMPYNYAGKSGLKLPAIQLGMWYNFGRHDNFENCRAMMRTAFDNGITLFDLANNYCESTAEFVVGEILKSDFGAYRDQILVTSKAGYQDMPGPYGEWGSKKSVIASLDRSLRKMQLDYFDIFYSHRFDPNTPLEETIHALCDAVKQGKMLYLGVSNYSGKDAQRAYEIAKSRNVPLIVNQVRYNIFDRGIEQTGAQNTDDLSLVCFSPLQQGLLTNKYLKDIPTDSRTAKQLNPHMTDTEVEKFLPKVKALNELAQAREQSLSQMALQWVLSRKSVGSALIGASKPSQIIECANAASFAPLSDAELKKIDEIAL